MVIVIFTYRIAYPWIGGRRMKDLRLPYLVNDYIEYISNDRGGAGEICYL